METEKITLVKVEKKDIVNGHFEVPDNITHIGDWAFYNNQLTSIDLKNVTHIGDWAFRGNVEITQNGKSIRMIDGIATFLYNSKTIAGFEVFKGEFFNTKKLCYVAKKGDFTAHGKTSKKSVEDVNFKFLQANLDVEKLVNEIKEKGFMSVIDFRLITGACELGCKNFLNEKGIANIKELPLFDAIFLIRNQFGWDRISKYFE